MIENVTNTWRSGRTVAGLYIIRSCREGCRDRIRIGAGGNRGGKFGLYNRLKRHVGPTPERDRKYETHNSEPFDVDKPIYVWGLLGWKPRFIDDGEICLYHAFITRYKRVEGIFPDRSLFLVPEDEDFCEVISEVNEDLQGLEKFIDSNHK